MTTGVQLYLVSACSSAEEFVAAFRRYAERGGLFVPCSEPLSLGKRGRVAITLKDGGVMLEGDVEVIGATPKPMGMHGRVGMTLKFVEPDEPSKALLAELDKARLAMKPAPTTAVPRPSGVPAEPRPIVPPIGGRIDPANALAECVAIGDATALKDVVVSKSSNDSGGIAGKFVIPTIPTMGGRPKTPSTPPALTARPKPQSVPPPTPAIGVPIKGHSKPTRMGMPAIDRLPADVLPIVPLTPVPQTVPGVSAPVGLDDKPTEIKQPLDPKRLAGEVSETKPIEPKLTPTEIATPPPPAGIATADAKPKLTSTNIATPPPVGLDSATPPPTPAAAKPPPPAPTTLGMSPIERTPAAPPTPHVAKPTTHGMAPLKAPRTPTPYAPMPIVRLPAGDPDAEETDLSGGPIAASVPAAKLGLVAMSAVPVAAPIEDSGRAYVGPPPKPPAPEPEPAPATANRSGGLRASEIMAAIAPSDDWTMTPDASQPTVVPSEDKPDAKVDAKKDPKLPPSGDWTISADPSSADGWSAPSKVEKLQQPATGNRVIAVSSDKPLEAIEWEEKPTGIGEPLVQIDPTLMEPLRAVPTDDEPANIIGAPPRDVPPPLGPGFAPPPLGPGFPQPGFAPPGFPPGAPVPPSSVPGFDAPGFPPGFAPPGVAPSAPGFAPGSAPPGFAPPDAPGFPPGVPPGVAPDAQFAGGAAPGFAPGLAPDAQFAGGAAPGFAPGFAPPAGGAAPGFAPGFAPPDAQFAGGAAPGFAPGFAPPDAQFAGGAAPGFAPGFAPPDAQFAGGAAPGFAPGFAPPDAQFAGGAAPGFAPGFAPPDAQFAGGAPGFAPGFAPPDAQFAGGAAPGFAPGFAPPDAGGAAPGFEPGFAPPGSAPGLASSPGAPLAPSLPPPPAPGFAPPGAPAFPPGAPQGFAPPGAPGFVSPLGAPLAPPPPPHIPTPPPGSIQLPAAPNATGQSVAIPTPAPQMFDLQQYMQNAPRPPTPMSNVAVDMVARPPRHDLTDANTGFFRDSGEIPRYPTEGVAAMDSGRSKRTLLFAIGGAVAVAAIIVVVMLLIGGKSGGAGSGSATGSAGSARASLADAATAMMQPPALDAAEATPPPAIDAGPVAPTSCSVDVTSVPTGAEVLDANDAVLGTTPATLALPCNVEAKLTVRKAKFSNVTKSIAPKQEHASLQFRLIAPMFSIKVTSTPSGATITVRGKTVGITPTTIRIPAFQSTAVSLSKDGFQTDTQTLTPRANNATHFVVLKRGAKTQKLH